MTPALNISSEVDDEVSNYFRGLGYEVSWDFSKRTGHHWYEIYDGGKQIAQIDFGIPLTALLEDLAQFAVDKDGTSPYTYEVRGTPENFAAIWKRISESLS